MEIMQNTKNNLNQDDSKTTNTPETLKVQVALRVRPFISKEIIDNESKCVKCYPESNQVVMGKDRQFVFDKVFDENAKQYEVYEYCAKGLVLGCLNGYNATVLAYGQTGSGKTYTMGSTTACDYKSQNIGIIPRVIKDLFMEIEAKKENVEFLVKVSFLEIYNEDINDLLDPSLTNTRLKMSQNTLTKNPISIREEKDGSISVYGATEEKVSSYEEIAACLERGSLHRTTASTLMNETSSRSHAIFTISIDQNQITEQKGTLENTFMTAKFHFVDLAGSERAKKTGATGTVLREGININRGLLALGNVISALTDDTSKIFHIPYRESKLTRILQDSLGGNSRTIMIACISPAESNFEESLNTLKYATRTRNIRNKPIINRDPQSAMITQLKQQLFELQNEILGYKRLLISHNLINGNATNNSNNANGISNNSNINISNGITKDNKINNFPNSLKSLNIMIDTTEELKSCKIKIVQYEKQLNSVLNELLTVKKSLNESEINLYSIQKERDLLKILNDKYKAKLEEHQITITIDDNLIELESKNIIEEYTQKIEKLKQELNDQVKMNKELQNEYENLLKSSNQEHDLLLNKTKMVQVLQKKLREMEKLRKSQQVISGNDSKTKDNIEPSSSSSSSVDFISQNSQQNTIQNADAEHLSNQNIIYETENEGSDDDNEHENEEDDNNMIEEDELMEKQFEKASQLHKKEMLLVDGTLNEKEELLRNITNNQMILEKNLVDDMKEEYHQKIHQLENELKTLEKQRDEAINKANSVGHNDRDKIITNYKQKITELEGRMKDFRKKEKEQSNLMRLVQSQQAKLKELDEEIKKIKAQKIQLAKKMREESEKYEKWKNSRQRELMQIKKKNLEKDAEIQKLKNENKRKDMIFKKKTEELLAKHISQDLLKQIQVTPSRITNSSSLSNRDKNKLQKSIELKLNIIKEDSPNISEEKLRELVDACTQKLIENLELNYNIQKEEENLRKTENELDIEQKKHAEILLKKDKLELDLKNPELDIEIENNYQIQLQEYKLECEDISSRIESLEEKIKYQQIKVNELTKELSSKPEFNAEEMLINNKNKMNTTMILRILLAKFIAASFDLYKLQEIIKQYSIEMQELKKKYEESEQKSRLAELQFEINLTKLKKEYENRQLDLIKNFEEDNENAQGLSQMNSDSEREINVNHDEEKLTANNNNNLSNTNNDSGCESTVSLSLNLAQIKQKKPNNMSNNDNSTAITALANNKLITPRHNTDLKFENIPLKRAETMVLNTIAVNNNSNNIQQRSNNEALTEANKRLEKTISDMRWKQKESDRYIETLKRKCEILQLKCDQLKKQTAKERFIGISKNQDDQLNSSFQSTAFSSAHNTGIQHSSSSISSSLMNSQIISASSINMSLQNSQSVSYAISQNQNQANNQAKTLSNQKSLNNLNSNIKNPSTPQNKLNLASLKDRRKEEKEHKTVIITNKLVSPMNNTDEHKLTRSLTSSSLITLTAKANIAVIAQGGQTTNNNNNNGITQVKNTKNTNQANDPKKNSSPPRLGGKGYMENLSLSNTNLSIDIGEGLSDLKGTILDTECTENSEKQRYITDDTFFNDDSNMNYDNNLWKCSGSWEAHKGQVYCITSQGNNIYSSSNKTVKIWSLDNLKLIHSINAHFGFIKSMVIWSERNVLATACDKILNLWDLTSSKLIYSLRAKDEIRTMHVYNDILFTAGKGSLTNGAILTWDLRSINPVEEKEKNQDIFSLISHDNILYYGCRNHQVRRVNLLNMESLAPFEPPHFDVVTSLAIVKDYLVSGSRDKNLRLWNLDTRIQNLKNTSYAHQGWVNVIETNSSKSLLYSGSKDGTVKVWGIRNAKLRCLSDINAHSQSVNSMCKIVDVHENMFATASNDKTIKLWKPTKNDDILNMSKNYEDIIDETHNISGLNPINTTRSYGNITGRDSIDYDLEK